MSFALFLEEGDQNVESPRNMTEDDQSKQLQGLEKTKWRKGEP